MNYPIGMRIFPSMQKVPLEHVINWAKSEAGLDVIDLPYIDDEVAAKCAQVGIGIGSIDAIDPAGTLSQDSDRRKRAVESMQHQIRDMGRLQQKTLWMCLVPEDKHQSKRESFKYWEQSFREIVPVAEEMGVFIAIEGWPGPDPTYPAIGCTPEMLSAMLSSIPSQSLGVNYDPSHLIRLGIDYMRFLKEFGQRIYHCHGKDTSVMPEALFEYGNLPPVFDQRLRYSGGSWRYTIPGFGVADWPAIVAALDIANYRGAISIELEDHVFSGNLEREQTGVLKAARFLSTLVRC